MLASDSDLPAVGGPGAGEAQRYSDPRADRLRAAYLSAFGGSAYPVPVERIAEDLLGLEICEGPLEVSGMIVPLERRIWLKEDEPADRKRFTLAHELGHWVCQCLEGRGEAVMCRIAAVDPDLADAVQRAAEREANIFAKELLMPADAVRAAWQELGDVAACAQRFAVSTEALHWRLFNMQLVGDRPEPYAG